MKDDIKDILDVFQQLNRVPRRSKHEQKISRWLLNTAAKLGLQAKSDSKGNVVIQVPGSPGREDAPVVVIQGHMDMVCEKEAGSDHDFSKDPIEHVIEGEWMSAKETSLGADNGIAIAYCLAIARDRDLVHPPLELLFTVDEETGLNGARALGPGFIEGRILLNLDSEDEGVFTIGCAGGRDTMLSYEPQRTGIGENFTGVQITVGGLAGGHSGVEINLHRANALKLLARLLSKIFSDSNARLVSFSGGSAINAIPRDAEALIAVERGDVEKVTKIAEDMETVFGSEFAPAEKSIRIAANVSPLAGKSYTADFSKQLIALLRVIPSGPREYSITIPDLVETSSNLAIVREQDGKLIISTSQRGSIESSLDEIADDIALAGQLAGAAASFQNSYPSWQPDTESPLLKRCTDVYKRLFSKEAKVEAIHAGLECAVIGAIYDGMEMISFGPTIEHPHSPDERVHLPSVGTTWLFLLSLLESFA